MKTSPPLSPQVTHGMRTFRVVLENEIEIDCRIKSTVKTMLLTLADSTFYSDFCFYTFFPQFVLSVAFLFFMCLISKKITYFCFDLGGWWWVGRELSPIHLDTLSMPATQQPGPGQAKAGSWELHLLYRCLGVTFFFERQIQREGKAEFFHLLVQSLDGSNVWN